MDPFFVALFMYASMASTSLMVASPFNLFARHEMTLMLDLTYPFLGSILSMDGESNLGAVFSPQFFSGMPSTGHLAGTAMSSIVKQKGTNAFLARLHAPFKTDWAALLGGVRKASRLFFDCSYRCLSYSALRRFCSGVSGWCRLEPLDLIPTRNSIESGN